MKNILLITSSYPGAGGQSTSAYHLQKLLNANGFNTKIIFLLKNNHQNIDPDNIGNCFRIKIKPTLANLIIKWIRVSRLYSFKVKYLESALRDKYHTYYYGLKVKFLLRKENFIPDLVITNVPLYINWVQNSFPKTLAIIGSNQEMYNLAKSGITALDLLNSKINKPNKLELTTDLSNTNVVFNSELTRDIYLKLGYKPKTQSVQYLNFAPYSLLNNSLLFNERNYAIGFITSHFARRIKNPVLARNIFKLFQDENKLVIGNNHQDYSKISNTNYFELVPQKVLAKFLSETKLVIITSYFDSSPSLLSEAIINGCNVLVSKNVGGNNLLGEESVIENYNDINEWKEKVNYLISNKVEYTKFQQHISNSKTEIITLLKEFNRL